MRKNAVFSVIHVHENSMQTCKFLHDHFTETMKVDNNLF